MRKQGEITVFLSLILACIMSLFLGLVESARTAGARLYLEMACNSAMASVMSQYNRNLWDMYHLLFLEAESDLAVEQSFASYLGYYLEQENLYPAKMNEVKMTGKTVVTDDGGKALEQEILSYVEYRLPEVAADLVGIAQMTEDAGKAGDFEYLFDICREAGIKTRKLETCRIKVEKSLSEMEEILEELEYAVHEENDGRFVGQAELLKKKIQKFPNLMADYKDEVLKVARHLDGLKSEQKMNIEDSVAGENLRKEILAYEQVVDAAREQLEKYREMETVLEDSREYLEEAVEAFDDRETVENGEEYESEDNGPDWNYVRECLDSVVIPDGTASGSVDTEKAAALDRLAELYQRDLLELVLPENIDVSKKTVELKEIPSAGAELSSGEYSGGTITEQFLINEYCFLHFDSFLKKYLRGREPEKQPLSYEQEYILCGKKADRENLKGTVERLLTLRGAMNLLYLLGSPDKRMEADKLAMAVSGGYVPIQFILSFFILTIWAFGEAVCDVKCLLAGGGAAFWKNQDSWKLGLDELLAFQFPEPAASERKDETGNNYQDYIRILFLLMDKEERNFRMMDVIEWNVRSIQEDFSVTDCMTNVKMKAEVTEHHLFFLQTEYSRSAEAVGAY